MADAGMIAGKTCRTSYDAAQMQQSLASAQAALQSSSKSGRIIFGDYVR